MHPIIQNPGLCTPALVMDQSGAPSAGPVHPALEGLAPAHVKGRELRSRVPTTGMQTSTQPWGSPFTALSTPPHGAQVALGPGWG